MVCKVGLESLLKGANGVGRRERTKVLILRQGSHQDMQNKRGREESEWNRVPRFQALYYILNVNSIYHSVHNGRQYHAILYHCLKQYNYTKNV